MPAFAKENNLLLYKGSNFLKQRLLLSTLSGKPVKIVDIRSGDVNPGLAEYEISLIRLFDKITNGSEIELNQTGTRLYYKPGLLLGGTFHHNCCSTRGIGYYLDVLFALAPFCKNQLNVTLNGVTNSEESPSVDNFKMAAIPVLKKFLVDDEGLELKIVRRGLMPLGGGEVVFKCPVRQKLRSVQCSQYGMVKRVRGTAFFSKVSPSLANRTVESAKGCLLKFLPDIYIYTDQNESKKSGNSPGFGINLCAETTEGVFYFAESTSKVRKEQKEPVLAEDVGKEAAMKLLDEIYRGGCVDSTFQWMIVLFMALGQKNVTKFLIGPMSQYTIHFLQHLRDFLAIVFKFENLENDEDYTSPGAQKVLLTCVGIGYTNINKAVI